MGRQRRQGREGLVEFGTGRVGTKTHDGLACLQSGSGLGRRLAMTIWGGLIHVGTIALPWITTGWRSMLSSDIDNYMRNPATLP